MEFKQIYISDTLTKFFSENIKNRWNLVNYTDKKLPAIFFGLYTDKDREMLSNHQNKSLIIWGGNDLTHNKSLSLVKGLIDKKLSVTWAYPGYFSNVLDINKIKHKKLYVPIKNYDEFKPTTLGDKIYCYKGILGNRSNYFKWDNVIEPLIKRYGEDKIIYTEKKDIVTLKKDFYENSFVYIKPNEKGGCTTMFELAHMGRKTIGIGHEENNFFLNYKNIDDLCRKIDKESKKIGTINQITSDEIKKTFINNNDWLKYEYYE